MTNHEHVRQEGLEGSRQSRDYDVTMTSYLMATSWLPHGYLMFTSCWYDSQHDSLNESDSDSSNDSGSDSDNDSFNESDSETSCVSTGI